MKRLVVFTVLSAVLLWQACAPTDNLPHCTLDCTNQCAMDGSCECRVFPATATDPGGPECTPVTDANCAQSNGCTQEGNCELSDGVYSPCTAANNSDCSNSAICLTMGACSALAEDGFDGGDGLGDCVVQTNANCEQSSGCKDDGYCYASAQECCANSSGQCQ